MSYMLKPTLTLSEKHEMEHFKEAIYLVQRMADEEGFSVEVREEDYEFTFHSKEIRDRVMGRLAMFFDAYK
jgi:adenylyl- and sulfurtransferase ThiI